MYKLKSEYLLILHDINVIKQFGPSPITRSLSFFFFFNGKERNKIILKTLWVFNFVNLKLPKHNHEIMHAYRYTWSHGFY